MSRGLTVVVLLVFICAGGAAGQSRVTAAPDAAVQSALQQYAAALQSFDAAAVKRVQPSIDVASLTTAFRDMRSLEVVISDVRVLSEETAVTRVSCRISQTLTPKAGSKRTVAVTRVIRLRKQDGNWLIDAFER